MQLNSGEIFITTECNPLGWQYFHVLITMFYRLVLTLFILCRSDIYFIGGFGTVAWVDVKEFENAQPDIIAANGAEQTLKV